MHDFFCFHDDNKNKAVEAHIPWDSKTKKPQDREFMTKKLRHRDSGTKTPWH